MAYSKLPKVVQDYPLGYQDLNQAIDNNAALRDLYDAKHGAREPSQLGANRWALAGVHDDVHVARTVARVTVATVATVVTPTLEVTGLAITGVTRVGTGQYALAVSGLASWWAAVTAEGTTTQRKTISYRVQPTGGQHEIYVTTMELGSGLFQEADYGFDVVVWGTP